MKNYKELENKKNLEKNYSIQKLNLFLTLFAINILIYGKKLFFYSLATDDYSRFFEKGRDQAHWLGRWMAGIINKEIFTGSLQILPYFNSLIGIFCITLAGFLTALFLTKDETKKQDIYFVSLLISITPFFAHNLFFNTNISTWISVLYGTVGILLLYHSKKLFNLLGFLLLITAIGTYQTIIQVAIFIILIKAMLELNKTENMEEIKEITKRALFMIFLVFCAFFASMLINKFYILFYHLKIWGRFKKAVEPVTFSVYIQRLIKMFKNTYHIKFRLLYFQKPFKFFFILSFLIAVYSCFLVVLKSKKKFIKLTTNILFFISIPIIIYLPLITGNNVPTRAHYAIGWLIAGFYLFSSESYSKQLKTFSVIVFSCLLIISSFYINVFFDAASRQTNADILRANQIVNLIRSNPNYKSEPVKFRIVGTKSFPVKGWKSDQQAFNKSWSKYKIFEIFTDFNFTYLNSGEYKELKNKLINKNIKIDEYPAKNSIIIMDNSVILILNKKDF